MKLKWKRKNESGQVISHCGRYWISTPRPGEPAEHYKRGIRWTHNIWHDDTGMRVGQTGNLPDAKVAAQEHHDALKRIDDDGPTEDDLNPAPYSDDEVAQATIQTLVFQQLDSMNLMRAIVFAFESKPGDYVPKLHERQAIAVNEVRKAVTKWNEQVKATS
jgi:hypothetical protein